MKPTPEELKQLKRAHSATAIQLRLANAGKAGYLKDFIYGAIDGLVTTFAVVSGVIGASLSVQIVLILGVANLIADGFSMGAANFLGTKAELEARTKARETELYHIQHIPEGEREEVRQIYAAKGFEGEDLEKIVETITADTDRWLETMLHEEFGLSKAEPSAIRAGVSTFGAFMLAGAVPLIPFCWVKTELVGTEYFFLSAALTGLTFVVIGAVKGKILERSIWRSAFETLVIGMIASLLAFLTGYLLRHYLAV